MPNEILALKTKKKSHLKQFLVPIINLCLSTIQMALKDFFFYLVCNSNSQKKINLVWIWAASCLTNSPHIYGYYVSEGTKISAGYRSGPFQSQNTCLASIPKVLFYYFQKYLNWNDKYFKKRNMNPLTQTHTHMHTHKHINTHTYIHTNTHTHTHTHTPPDYGAHPPLFIF